MASIAISRRFISLPSHLRSWVVREALIASKIRPASRLASPPCQSRSLATYNTNFSAASADHAPPSSVNQTEVLHFNTLASSWWDPHGSSRLLHLMNPLRHQFIKKCIGPSTLPPNKKLKFLDIGCGGGIFAESAARLDVAESVVGIDPTPEVIAVARRHARQDPSLLPALGKLEYKNIAIEQLPPPTTPEAGFDIITLFEVIEHIQTPSPFLRTILQHLKPGGWLIGSTIARTNTSWFTTKFMAEEVLRMVPRGTHEWSQYIQPSEMREWARGQPDLEVVVGGEGWKQMGVVYVPGFGWKEVEGSEDWGNYFFGVRKRCGVVEEV